jgi:flagellin
LLAGVYKSQVATASSIAGASTTAMGGSDVMINGVSVPASTNLSYDTASTAGATISALSKAAAINSVGSQTGVSAAASTEKLGVEITAAASTGTITINGVATASITTTASAASDRAAVVSAINLISNRTGVVATDLGGITANNSIKLTAADGRNVIITTSFTASTTTSIAAGTTYGTVNLTSSKAFTLEQGQSTTANGVYASLGMYAGTYGTGRNGQSLTSINVSTVAGANAAIIAVDNAITSLNNSRANLGSVLNRFSSTVANLGVASENISAAQSRIRDTDFAKETAKLSRGQILQQAGVAMLAQANALPNTILALLK